MSLNLESLRAHLDERSDAELLSILRERNEDEWRPEVFPIVESILRARHVSTQAAPGEPAETREQEGLDSSLVEVWRYGSRAAAEESLEVLEAGGVKGWLVETAMVAHGDFEWGFQLKVRAEDEDQAWNLLDSYGDAPIVPPPEFKLPPCPQCGQPDTAHESEEEASEAYQGQRRSIWFWFFRCRACGHRWEDEGD